MIAGIQISSFKPLLTSANEVRKAFHKIKAMGCDTVQLQWIDPSVPICDIAAALQEVGLNAISLQEMYPQFDADREYYYELCRACHCDELCLSRIPEACTDTAALKGYAETLCQIHQNLQREGRHLSFHPTKNDYQMIDDMCKLDILLEYLPEDITLCLDLYHVEHAGLPIPETLNHYGSRVTEVHFKDYQLLADGSEILVPAGQGEIDWTETIRQCLDQNIPFGYVEQERWNRDPFECLNEAFCWLNSQIV